jgi:hypothetical protein
MVEMKWTSIETSDPAQLASELEEIVRNHAPSWVLAPTLERSSKFLRSLERVEQDAGGTQGAAPSAP